MTSIQMNAVRTNKVRTNTVGTGAVVGTVLGAILIGMTAISGAPQAWAQEPGFFDRIFGNSDRVAPGPAPQNQDFEDRGQQRPAVAQNRAPQGGDSTMRIDRLESQIRQLTGAIEQLQHRNQQLETQLRRVLDEAENRSPDTRGANVRPVAPGRPAANPSAAQAPAVVPPAATAPVASPQVAASQLAPPPVAAPQPAPPATTGPPPGTPDAPFDPSHNPG